MKWLVRSLVVLIALFTLLSLAGYLLRCSWGKDVAELNVQAGERAFRAQRDEMGAWRVEAAKPEDLWFAFGYVQAVDREFQTEFFRSIALGKLGELVGRSQFKRDRYMRFSARVSRDEWDRLPADSDVRRAAEQYVAGRKAFLGSPRTPEPIEYRLFNLTRQGFPEWEPWHVLALSRFHSWEFSYDFQEEARSLIAEKGLGASFARFLFPTGLEAQGALYSQETARPSVQKQPLGRGRVDVPAAFFPAADKTASLMPRPQPFESVAELEPEWRDLKWNGTDMGASNAWLVGDSRVGLQATICNDTHLGFSWPSPLYPVHYRLEVDAVEASGFMLPGLPVMVIGNVNRGDSSLAWGITMAAFADVQDLVAIDAKTLRKARIVEETFRFRDPRTGELSEEKLNDEWTEFGPRVDTFLAAGERAPLALDWLGFRRSPSTLDFFLRRNIQGAASLREDLASRWTYPAVNFLWVEREGNSPSVAGHSVTGLIFDRDRSGHRRPITESEARQRRYSQPAERPWLERKDGGDAYLFVSGNQSIWPGDLSRRTASEWIDSARAQAILEGAKQIILKPEAPQTDFRSPSLESFLREARKLVSANRLCAEMGSELILSCQRILSALDGWNGALERDDWVPTLVAGWYVRTKAELWPTGLRKGDEDVSGAFLSWHRSNASNQVLRSLFADPKARLEWEKLSGRLLTDVLVDAFRAHLSALAEARGPLTSQWTWGSFHRISWQHPAALAPEPLGSFLRDGLLGVAPAVPGGLDSPGRMDFSWSPERPLEFPAKHGAVMRFCATPTGQGKTNFRWANSTGTSGNPFSAWSRKFPAETFFQEKLIEVKAPGSAP